MIDNVLLVYNNYKIHSAMEMRPKDAGKPENVEKVIEAIEKHKYIIENMMK